MVAYPDLKPGLKSYRIFEKLKPGFRFFLFEAISNPDVQPYKITKSCIYITRLANPLKFEMTNLMRMCNQFSKDAHEWSSFGPWGDVVMFLFKEVFFMLVHSQFFSLLISSSIQ